MIKEKGCSAVNVAFFGVGIISDVRETVRPAMQHKNEGSKGQDIFCLHHPT